MTEPPEDPALDALAPDVPAPDDLASDAPTPDTPAPDASAPEVPAPELSAPTISDRRLAAILFADVAGYTALSSHDEDLALSMIKAFQRVSKKVVGDKGGRVVKFLGDGMLAEFTSLDAAVNSAHALQNTFTDLKEVKESRVSLRVGVHLGDIVFSEDGDVYGSGVNVASRIESHAPLAGVVVSDSAYQQLRHRRHYEFSSLGEKDLKGVPDPMELYVVLLADKEASPPPVRGQRKPDKSSRAGERRSRERWTAVGLALVAGVSAVVMDLGGVQGQVDQVLQNLGLPAAFTRGVFAQSPGFRAIEGGAAIDSEITVGFSGLINPATATSSTVQLVGPGGALVPTEVSASENALAVNITPLSPLAYATRYRIVLTDALRASSGEEIGPPQGRGSPEDLLSFLTQSVPPDPPVLTSTEPADGSTGADGGSPVFATFSKPMNPLTLDAATVMLITESGDRVASGLTCCGEDDGTLRVDPAEPLAAGLYQLVLGDRITDAGGGGSHATRYVRISGGSGSPTRRAQRSWTIDDTGDPGIGRISDDRGHRWGNLGPSAHRESRSFGGGCPPDRDFRHVRVLAPHHPYLRCQPDAVSCPATHSEGGGDTLWNDLHRFQTGWEGLHGRRRARPHRTRDLSGGGRAGSHPGNSAARCGYGDPCALRRRLQSGAPRGQVLGPSRAPGALILDKHRPRVMDVF